MVCQSDKIYNLIAYLFLFCLVLFFLFVFLFVFCFVFFFFAGGGSINTRSGILTGEFGDPFVSESIREFLAFYSLERILV